MSSVGSDLQTGDSPGQLVKPPERLYFMLSFSKRKRSAILFRTSTLAVVVAATLTQTPAYASPAPSDSPGAATQQTNPYSPKVGHPYRHGAFTTRATNSKMKNWQRANIQATGPQTLSYGGGVNGIGVTSGTPKVYLIFYGTQWGTQGTDTGGNLTFSTDTAGGAPQLQNMFKGLGTGSELWSGVMTQYCDGPLVAPGATSCPVGAPHVGYPTGGNLAGVWFDNATASPAAATALQLGNEAVSAASHFDNTTAASNRDAQYVILSAPGLNPDNYQTGGFCAWHDYNGDVGASSGVGDVAFTNMPYTMDQGTSCGQNFVNGNGTLDGVSIVEGHEYAETSTDQNPAGGWTNKTGGTYNGQENADECAWISPGSAGGAGNVAMGNGSYAEQATWSNDTNRCDLSHVIVTG